ncbi:MAG: hypothetical protein WBA31_01115 [Candidatus Dormiibacterota bacterium]
MQPVVRRILLVGATVAGLSGLGFGVATLTADAATGASGSTLAQQTAASTPTATPSPGSASPGSKTGNCPNMPGSGTSAS